MNRFQPIDASLQASMTQSDRVSEPLTDAPLVSFVIPTFNVPREILEVSLGSVVNQTFRNFEALVIDESSDPTCAEAVKAVCERDKRFIYVRPEGRLGLAGSLNLGLSLAKGEFIARFDSDDIAQPDRIDKQLAFMRAHPEIGVLGGAMDIINNAGVVTAHRRYPTDHCTIEKKFQTTNALAHPTVMMRHSAIRQIGGYDPSFKYSEDLELWLRMLNHGVKMANLPDVLIQYRQEQTNRPTDNWKFNVRARRKNRSARHPVRSMLGVMAISSWSRTPVAVQRMVFRMLLLRRRTAQHVDT
jgi:glycosyltransferase involved in cell wall biosynthesis